MKKMKFYSRTVQISDEQFEMYKECLKHIFCLRCKHYKQCPIYIYDENGYNYWVAPYELRRIVK